MFSASRPVALLWSAMDALVAQLPPLRLGTEEGFHQSRVAIRRTREALALVRTEVGHDEVSAIEDRLRRAFKALGRVRDADVGQQLAQQLEERFVTAPVTMTQLRGALRADQLAARRKALKRVEKLDLAALPAELRGALRRSPISRWDWKAVLRHHITLRAERARQTMAHAGGVYFPNRVHNARVAIKQLRYALEFATVAGTWDDPPALRALKKAQDTLGDVHDREVLLGRLDALAAGDPPADRREVEALKHFVMADALALHARYLRRLPQLEAIAASFTPSRRSSATRALIVAGVGVPSLLLLRKRA